MHYKAKLLLMPILIAVILVSGCVGQSGSQQPAASVAACGNSVVDAGEECDNSACAAGEICSDARRCEAAAPPTIPE